MLFTPILNITSYATFPVVPGNIEALKLVWILGDAFLREIVPTLRTIKIQSKKNNNPLYLTDNYNVETLHADRWSNIRSFLARLFNHLVTALNTPPYVLPRYILIIIDRDLITNAELYDYGVSRTLEDTLKWILINIDQTIETRKEDLVEKRPCAVSTTSEPRLVWINMIKHPDNSMNKQVYSLSRKFNEILERVIAGNKRSHYLKLELPLTSQNFDYTGNLSQIGQQS